MSHEVDGFLEAEVGAMNAGAALYSGLYVTSRLGNEVSRLLAADQVRTSAAFVRAGAMQDEIDAGLAAMKRWFWKFT
jgi:hypothetical protein